MKINLALKSVIAFAAGLIGAILIVAVFLLPPITIAQSKQQIPEGPTSVEQANAPLALTIVKGLSTSPACAATASLAVLASTPVYYCYYISNPNGPNSYISMTLFDSELGQVAVFPTAFGVNATKFFSVGPINTGIIVAITTTLATVAANRSDNASVDYATSANAVLTVNPIIVDATLKKTVGTIGNNTCASTTTISIIQGTPVYYCYVVQNTGNVPVQTVNLVDDKTTPSTLDSTVTVLQPGATRALVSPAQILGITTTNTAIWTVQTLVTLPVAISKAAIMTATVNWRPLTASIALTKTVGTAPSPTCATTKTITVLPGTQVYYCYTIVNTGDVSVTTVSLADNKIAGPFVLPAGVLLPGGTQTIVGVAATPAVTTTNTATWTVQVPVGPLAGIQASASNNATVNVAPPTPGLAIVKTVSLNANCSNATDPISVGPGVPLYYCYALNNTGGYSLTNIGVADTDGGTLTPPVTTFAIGASTTFTRGPFIKNVAGVTDISTVTWQAFYVNNGVSTSLSTNDTATINVQAAVTSMTMVKTVALSSGGCGGSNILATAINTSVRYCYTVTNTGNTTLSGFSVVDAQLGAITSGITTLAPGAIAFFFSPPFAAAPVGSNTVSVTTTANSSDGGTASANAFTILTVTLADPTIKLLVGVSTTPVCTVSDTIYVPSGTSVYYCFTVENTSTAPHTLTHHALTTERFGVVFTNANISLAPGAVYTYLHPTAQLINQTNRTNNSTWTSVVQGLAGVSASATENATACLSSVVGNFPCHLSPTAVPVGPATPTPPPTPVIDLVAGINTSGSPVVNQALTINLVVNNSGTAAAGVVTLAATLPANATFQSLNSNGLSCTTIPAVGSAGGNLACSVPGGLAAGTSKTISVVVNPTSVTGNSINLSVATTSAEPNVTNNTQTLNLSGARLFMPMLTILLKLIGLE